MSAAAAPRLTGGIVASVLLHGGLVAAFLLLRSPAPPPAPPMIRVSMVASPAGPRQPGVVQEAPPAVAEPPKAEAPKREAPKPEAPKPQPAVAAPPPKPTAATAVAKSKTAPTPPKQATATAPPKSGATPPAQAPATTPPKSAPSPATSAPTAGGGPVGGKGADVATVETPGIDFDYPYYTKNIVTRLIQYFGNFNGSLKAEVRFVIRRDGSVDPASIRLVTPSGNYTFDQRALGAVEAAANAKVFGSLPGGFREDILPVTFWFSPQVIR